MADIRWTDEAAAWLEDIYKYIALDDPAAAAW
jgi:plasmid stabilization system protein ParE